MVKKIAITGGMGCGKSSFARMLKENECPVLETDEIVRDLESPGGAACGPIRRTFGESVMNPEGGVDQRELARIVFSDCSARRRLNGLVHPLVRSRMNAWLRERARDDEMVAAVVIPLLFEAGWEAGWDMIVCVACASDLQIQRLRERGYPPAQARKRIAAQMPLAEKMRRSDRVIENSGEPERLREFAQDVLKKILEKDYE